MAEMYAWSAGRVGGAYRLPGPGHLGWWAAVAMLFSVLLHVVVFFALDRMKLELRFEAPQEIKTRPVTLRPLDEQPADIQPALPPEEIVRPPSDTAKLLDDIDMADLLPKDQEIDIKPQIDEAEYAVKLVNPAQEGAPEAVAMEVASGMDLTSDLPELGREPESIRPAAIGQLTVDPGSVTAEDSRLDGFTQDLIRQGAEGKVEKGSLEGVTSLDKMLDLPPNVLVGKKTMLPSDLLFEFNSSELRESAKVGLMKLSLLIDRNPSLYCWIEGHTDLVGGDDFNLNLSVKRAEAVRSYLVASLKMDASKIVTRGFGRYQPIVATGTQQEQAANRRVEIRMRKTPPEGGQMKIEPRKAQVIEEIPSPKAILVKPARPLPVEEMPPSGDAPKATPIEESPPPRATPVAPKATPVPEISEPAGPPRAAPVEPLRAEPVEQ